MRRSRVIVLLVLALVLVTGIGVSVVAISTTGMVPPSTPHMVNGSIAPAGDGDGDADDLVGGSASPDEDNDD